MFHWLKNFFVKTLFGFNILASVLLCCVYLAAWTPPSQFHYFAILAIGYPFLLFVNFVFAAWWLYRRQRYFYLSTVVLILGWSHFLNFFGLSWFNTSPTPDTVRVLSYNTHYFNATALKDKEILEIEQLKILRTIQEQPVDIFCGQEFTGKTEAYNEKTNRFLANEMGLKHHFRGGQSSLAIFSKYPIVKTGVIDFKDSYNGAIYADLQFGKKVIRVYSFHLQSIKLGSDENEIFNQKNLSSLNEDETQAKYKRIGNKLKQAFLLREEQANYIAEHIQKSPYPVLFCGDMNDTPMSYAYAQLSYGLTDAFRAKGSGFGSTYAGIFPFLRIDYIFTSLQCKVQAFQVVKNTSSDHYPIYAHVRIN